jgi:anti-sigma factor RsiW
MKPEIQRHLSDEALDDVLIGLGSLASHAHLAQCPTCRARVESFQSTIGLFREASLGYSKAQPVRTPPAAQGSKSRRIFGQPVFATWAAAAALLILGGPAAWHVFAPHSVHAPAVANQSQDSDSQIAEDNELLKQVNAAIAAPDEQSVVDEYHLLDGSIPQPQPKMRTE